MQNDSEFKLWAKRTKPHAIPMEDDETAEREDEAQLIGQLQEKLEMSREEIKRILQKL